jgi:hypothetical protein
MTITAMKAITIWQPWASLKACGAKEFETRGWETKYRGPIAIHAAVKTFSPLDFAVFDPNLAKSITEILKKNGMSIHNLPFGCVIATGELVNCWKIHGAHGRGASIRNVFIDRYDPDDPNHITMISPQELLFGDWTPGRYAWEFANMRMLATPIPEKGKQGLWNWEPITQKSGAEGMAPD